MAKLSGPWTGGQVDDRVCEQCGKRGCHYSYIKGFMGIGGEHWFCSTGCGNAWIRDNGK